MRSELVEILLYQLTSNRPHCSYVGPLTSSKFVLELTEDNLQGSLEVARKYLEKDKKNATLYYAYCPAELSPVLVIMDLEKDEVTLCDPGTLLPLVFLETFSLTAFIDNRGWFAGNKGIGHASYEDLAGPVLQSHQISIHQTGVQCDCPTSSHRDLESDLSSDLGRHGSSGEPDVRDVRI